MSKIIFIIGLFHGLLVVQGKRWQESTSAPIRFICFWGLTLYGVAIAYQLSQLPKGSFEYLTTHLFEPFTAFILFILTMLSMIGALTVVMAGKLKASL